MENKVNFRPITRRSVVRGLDRGTLAAARLNMALVAKGVPLYVSNQWTEPKTYTPNNTAATWRRVLAGTFHIEG